MQLSNNAMAAGKEGRPRAAVHFGVSMTLAQTPPQLASEVAFLDYLDVSTNEIRKIWYFRERMYHQIKFTKDNGKSRIIHAPDRRLKHLQRQVAQLLDQLYRVRNPVHGFVPKKSIKTNALSHLRKRFVLNIDLKNFFPSITETRVTGLLKSLGIESSVATMIARLCCCQNRLPQGAPTSPVLSNMICFRLDKELLTFAKGKRCIYTRYADDLTLSSHQPMSALFETSPPPSGHFDSDLLVVALRDIVTTNGFTINPEKVHYADRHSRRMVTGLKVNEFVNVDRRFVRNIRAALYSVEKQGKQAAQEKFNSEYHGRSSLGEHLRGKIAWLRQIRGQSDPVFRSIAVRYNDSFPDHKIEVIPTPEDIRGRAVWVVEHFEGEMAQGSAFFLRDVGLVTAAHCIDQAQEVQVYHPSKPSNKFWAEVIKRDTDRDLAILGHDIPFSEYFEFERSRRTVVIGESLVAIGYPSFGPGDKTNFRSGSVCSRPMKSGVQLIEVTQKLSQGMSGGPLVDSSNAVVGVVHKGGSDEERDLVIDISVLDDWLSE